MMIIRMKHELRQALLKTPTDGAVADPVLLREASQVAGLVPDWLRGMAAEGAVIVLPREDYQGIPWQVQAFLDVMSR